MTPDRFATRNPGSPDGEAHFEPSSAAFGSRVLRGQAWVRNSCYAATSLAQLPANPSRAQEAVIAEVYDSLRGGAQHSKYTRPDRLKELDHHLAALLEARRFEGRICIHDMAASNAITSLEMFEHLRDRHAVSVKATDYYDRLCVVDVRTRWRVAFDTELRPVQYIGRRMMVCARRPDPNAAPVDTVVKPALQAALLPPALAVLARVSGGSNDLPEIGGEAQCRQIALFHPRCLSAAREQTGFSLGHDDIFAPCAARYDVVRVANTLSTEFMAEAKIIDGVRAVSATLGEGGLLILARNTEFGDGRSSGTIFARDADRLRPVADVLGGYQHRDAVSQIALS